jgi:uncharacterized protein (TIGR02466 family)
MKFSSLLCFSFIVFLSATPNSISSPLYSSLSSSLSPSSSFSVLSLWSFPLFSYDFSSSSSSSLLTDESSLLAFLNSSSSLPHSLFNSSSLFSRSSSDSNLFIFHNSSLIAEPQIFTLSPALPPFYLPPSSTGFSHSHSTLHSNDSEFYSFFSLPIDCYYLFGASLEISVKDPRQSANSVKFSVNYHQTGISINRSLDSRSILCFPSWSIRTILNRQNNQNNAKLVWLKYEITWKQEKERVANDFDQQVNKDFLDVLTAVPFLSSSFVSSVSHWSTLLYSSVDARLIHLSADLRLLLNRLFDHFASTQKSNRGGWQSAPHLFEAEKNPLIIELRHLVYSHFNRFLVTTMTELSHEKNSQWQFDINFAWGNINEYGNSNAIHSHPNAHFSGVLYVAIGNEDNWNQSSTIHFVNPTPAINIYGLNGDVNGVDPLLRSVEKIVVHPGMILLFPAWLDHYVEPHLQPNSKRYSIAFNALINRVPVSSNTPIKPNSFLVPSRHCHPKNPSFTDSNV